MRCKQVVEGATKYTEGAGGPLFRLRMHQHLQGCDPCQTYVKQLRLTSQVLAGLAKRELAPAEREWVLAAFRDAQAHWASAASTAPPPARRFGATSVAIGVSLIATLLGALIPHHHDTTGRSWALAAAFALAGTALVGLAARHAALASLLAGAGAVALLASAGAGELGLLVGLRCATHELVTAAMVVAAWLWARRSDSGTRLQLMGMAAASALASDAVLHVTCPNGGSLHALVFHVGGVIAAAAWTGMLGGKLLQLGSRAT